MKIICIGNNYKKHIEELKGSIPSEPMFFLKPDTSILKSGRSFYLPDFSEDMQHEIEIVLKINRLGKHIDSKFAHRYYDAIGLGIDFTARDLQRKCIKEGLPWEIAKSFDSSAAISEFIQKDDLPNPENISFKLMKNNQLVQEGETSDLIFNFDKIIEHVSKYITLKIGDLIFTGTPSGVGKIAIGDILTGYIEDKEILKIVIK